MAKVMGTVPDKSTIRGRSSKMRLIEKVLSEENIRTAIRKVKSNKGAPGIDEMKVDKIDEYFKEHGMEIKESIRNMKYRAQPVKRVYIPKPNGKKRPLGIPVVVDRVIQQALAQQMMVIYEPVFSEHSHGFRPNRSCHTAMMEVLGYLNEGYEWIIDLDIEKFFDTVSHDKLISILREQVNEKEVLSLVRTFLRAGIMDDGLVSPSVVGVPQGGPLSVVLSNIYLDKFDKELESRGLRFVRYADDCIILVRSEMAANRVMKSVTGWLERKLYLKVSGEKTKVVRPTKSQFLGFTFIRRNSKGWQCKPSDRSKMKLYDKIREVLKRNRAVATPMPYIFIRVNQIVKGWINYYRIGMMKIYIDKFGQWLRHKIRVIILKKWKKPDTIYRNLQLLNRATRANMSDEEIYKVANSRLGWYRRSGMYVVNYLISPKVLAIKKAERPGLVNPLNYYLSSL